MSKNFLVVGSYLPSILNFRGDLIKTLIAQGYRVTVCAPDAVDYPDEIAKIQALGVTYQEIPMARTGLNPFRDIATLLAIRQIIKTQHISHLLVYTIKPVVYGLLATIGLPTQHKTALVTGLGYAFGDGRGFKFRVVSSIASFLYRRALHCASRVVFQNPDDRQRFVDLKLVAADKTRVVNGSGINVDLFQHVPVAPNAVIRFLFIARLIREKGIYELIEATRRLKSLQTAVRVDVVGWIDDNPSAIQQQELDQWIAEGLIDFHGKLKDVKPVIEQCDVFVLPSFYPEGTPRTILESLAIGRAIITTDTPGCRETVIDGENGYLIQPRSVESLMDAMNKFVEDRTLISKMGLNSRRFAEDKYSVIKVNQDMLKYMEEC